MLYYNKEKSVEIHLDLAKSLSNVFSSNYNWKTFSEDIQNLEFVDTNALKCL